MATFTKEEFLRLIERLNDAQYGDEEIDYSDEEVWTSSAPKPKKQPENNGTINLINLKREKIQEAIYKCTNLKIDNFTIRVTKYHGLADKQGKGSNLFVDLAFFQEVFRTPSGAPCKMTYKFDVLKDNRFTERPWLNHCGPGGVATKVPIETAVEIVRWFQGIIRMTAFL